MSEPRFYIIQRPLAGYASFDANYADGLSVDAPHIVGAAPMCPVCGDVIGVRPWLPPHHMVLSNTNYPDFLVATFTLLASARLLALIDLEGLTGIAQVHPPAVIERVAGRRPENVKKQPPVYRAIEFSQLPVRFDEKASGFKRKSRAVCEWCLSQDEVRRRKGLVVDLETWDGTDLFCVRGSSAYKFASPRAVHIFRGAGITGTDFPPADTDVPPWQ